MSQEIRDDIKGKVYANLRVLADVIVEDNGVLDRLLDSGAVDLTKKEHGFGTANMVTQVLIEYKASRYASKQNKEGTDKAKKLLSILEEESKASV